MQEKIILGSKSPRRAEILGYFTLPFNQVASDFDEDSIPFEGKPEPYVLELSKRKAQKIAEKYPTAIILTADTIVYKDGKIFGKPRNEADAFETFSVLNDKWHSVFTGVTVKKGSEEFQKVEKTDVLFNKLSDGQIDHYIKRIEWQDKAAGYAIQAVGGLIVRKIDGCYYNVMGLPINTVEMLLKNVGIELWDYL